MENINTPADLKQAIRILEEQQSVLASQLREQFFLTYESLKPLNLIENTLKEIRLSPYLTDNIINAAIGLTAGYISRKAVIRESDSSLRKLFGTVLQFGITNFIAEHPENIRAFGKFIFQLLSRKKV